MTIRVSSYVAPFVKEGYILLGIPKINGKEQVDVLGYSGSIGYRGYDPYLYESILACDYDRVVVNRDGLVEDAHYVISQGTVSYVVMGAELMETELDLTKSDSILKLDLVVPDEEG